MKDNHDALREEWRKYFGADRSSSFDNLAGYELEKGIADWWIAKLEAQSARHRKELESIAREMDNAFESLLNDKNKAGIEYEGGLKFAVDEMRKRFETIVRARIEKILDNSTK